MAEYKVDLKEDRERGVYRLVVSTVGGFLSGDVGDPKVIAELFGGVRQKLIRSLKSPTAWLEELYVSEDMRHRGIATEILKRAVQTLRENGVRYALLQADPEFEEDRGRLVKLYRKFGFEEVREFMGELFGYPIMMVDLGWLAQKR